MKYVCGDCKKVFDEEQIATWREDRGEFWGQRAYETMWGCPYCFGVGIEEYDENKAECDDEGDDDDDS